jgi:hypothetical protein
MDDFVLVSVLSKRSDGDSPFMNSIKLTIAWMWIALPLGWGVYQSVQKSLPLFGMEASAPAKK